MATNVSKSSRDQLLTIFGSNDYVPLKKHIESLDFIQNIQILDVETIRCELKPDSDMRQFKDFPYRINDQISVHYLMQDPNDQNICHLHIQHAQEQELPDSGTSLEQFNSQHPFNQHFTMMQSGFEPTPMEDSHFNGHIKEIKPGLFQGQYKGNNGEAVYFIRESLPMVRTEKGQKSHPFNDWANFYFQSLVALDGFETHVFNYEPDTFSRLFKGYNSSEIMSELKKFNPYTNRLHLIEMLYKSYYAASESALSLRPQNLNDDYHILYISTQKVEDYLFSKKHKINSLDDYQQISKNLAIVVATASNGTRTIMRGIFKPPVAFLNQVKAQLRDDHGNTASLAVALQCFGAYFSKKEHHKYVTLSPLVKMYEMLSDYIEKSHNSAAFIKVDDSNKERFSSIVGSTTTRPNAAWKKEQQVVIDLEQFQNHFWSDTLQSD